MASYPLAVNNIANEFGENKLFMEIFHFANSCLQKRRILVLILNLFVDVQICSKYEVSSPPA